MKFYYNNQNSNEIKKFQQEAIKLGYLPANSDDGIDGPKTRMALQKMNSNYGLRNLELDVARDKFKEPINDGFSSALSTAISHVVLPEWLSIPMPGIKRQAAAIIAHKGLNKNGTNGLGYEDYAKMLNVSSNPNIQPTKDNAIGKSLGGANYHISEDGKKIIITDDYEFKILREPYKDKWGNIQWHANTTTDFLKPSNRHPQAKGLGNTKIALKGLWNDIKNGMLSSDYKIYLG